MDKFHYSLLKYLKNLSEEKNDSTLQTGVEYLVNYFNMEVNDENTNKYGNHDLPSIFLDAIQEKWSPELEKNFENYKQLLNKKGYFKDCKEGSKEYDDRLRKARERFYEKYSQDKKTNTNNNDTNNNDTNNNEIPPKKVFKTDVSEEQKKVAEDLKNKGNDAFKVGNFEEAIKLYTEAIEIYSSAIYYCNRGTSYGKISKNNEALEDFKICIELDPNYVKAYDRLGCVYMKLGNLKEAISYFQKGLKIEPNNKELKTHLTDALEQSQGDMGGMGEGEIPNLEQMQQMFMNNPQLLENMGPIQDMLQNNPQIMNVAMNLMNDPNFQQTMMNMMNNPQMTNLFSQFTGGGDKDKTDKTK